MASKNEVKGIRTREPLQKVATTSDIKTSEIIEDLSQLSLEQLKERYLTIHGQSQMMKGLILLEARERIPSDKEFGQWAATIGLSDSNSFQTRNVYMNFARFFKDRDMTGISLTAAYAISSPSNTAVAEEIYQEVIGKNLPVKEVKRLIEQKKSINGVSSSSIPTDTEKQHEEKQIVLPENIKTVLETVEGLHLQAADAIALLKECIKRIKS